MGQILNHRRIRVYVIIDEVRINCVLETNYRKLKVFQRSVRGSIYRINCMWSLSVGAISQFWNKEWVKNCLRTISTMTRGKMCWQDHKTALATTVLNLSAYEI